MIYLLYNWVNRCRAAGVIGQIMRSCDCNCPVSFQQQLNEQLRLLCANCRKSSVSSLLLLLLLLFCSIVLLTDKGALDKILMLLYRFWCVKVYPVCVCVFCMCACVYIAWHTHTHTRLWKHLWNNLCIYMFKLLFCHNETLRLAHCPPDDFR